MQFGIIRAIQCNRNANKSDIAKIIYLTNYAVLYYSWAMRKQLYKNIANDLKKTSLNALAIAMRIKQPTLHRIVRGKSRGNIDSWELIEAYYNKRDKKAV